MGLNKKEGGRIGFESGANKQIAIENAMSELRKKYPALQDAWEHYQNIKQMCETREKEEE